jgi:hypothetical protein
LLSFFKNHNSQFIPVSSILSSQIAVCIFLA